MSTNWQKTVELSISRPAGGAPLAEVVGELERRRFSSRQIMQITMEVEAAIRTAKANPKQWRKDRIRVNCRLSENELVVEIEGTMPDTPRLSFPKW